MTLHRDKRTEEVDCVSKVRRVIIDHSEVRNEVLERHVEGPSVPVLELGPVLVQPGQNSSQEKFGIGGDGEVSL